MFEEPERGKWGQMEERMKVGRKEKREARR
jgi:hypothetical protein